MPGGEATSGLSSSFFGGQFLSMPGGEAVALVLGVGGDGGPYADRPTFWWIFTSRLLVSPSVSSEVSAST